ncbi:MAG: HPt (histidine-containing phosphotransfer) domain-containing protein [Myxococcota bacterium]|jgi:HPt (histidine-containing phosphotransfer) domain-containing protein
MWNADRGPMAWLNRTLGRTAQAEPDAAPVLTPAPAPKKPWIDSDGLLSQISNDPELLRELTRLFDQERERRLVTLRAAIEAADATEIKSAAHAIKSGLTNFSAPEAVALAQELEMAGRAGISGDTAALEGLAPKVDVLSACMTEMLDELHTLGGTK